VRAQGRDPQTEHLGSALKFGRIAAGHADIYVRFGPTSAWDVAAGAAIIAGAGGGVFALGGQRLAPLRWDHDWLNGHFVAVGDVAGWRATWPGTAG